MDIKKLLIISAILAAITLIGTNLFINLTSGNLEGRQVTTKPLQIMDMDTYRAYDTQIKSDISTIRTDLERWYYADGSYLGYNEGSNFRQMSVMMPECSRIYLNPGQRGYQLKIHPNGQSYVFWSPLCVRSIQEEEIYYYCVDSGSKISESVTSPGELRDSEKYRCP